MSKIILFGCSLFFAGVAVAGGQPVTGSDVRELQNRLNHATALMKASQKKAPESVVHAAEVDKLQELTSMGSHMYKDLRGLTKTETTRLLKDNAILPVLVNTFEFSLSGWNFRIVSYSDLTRRGAGDGMVVSGSPAGFQRTNDNQFTIDFTTTCKFCEHEFKSPGGPYIDNNQGEFPEKFFPAGTFPDAPLMLARVFDFAHPGMSDHEDPEQLEWYSTVRSEVLSKMIAYFEKDDPRSVQTPELTEMLKNVKANQPAKTKE